MTQIPLLCAGLEKRVESRKVRTGRLKGRERVGAAIILKIIVSGEFLGGCDAVVQPNGELVGAQVPVAAGDQLIGGRVGLRLKLRNVLVVHTQGGGIETLGGNLSVRENCGIRLRSIAKGRLV